MTTKISYRANMKTKNDRVISYWKVELTGYGRYKFTYQYYQNLISTKFTDSEKFDRIKNRSKGWKKDLNYLKSLARIKYQFSK